jgi:hypothetical protein
MIVNNFLVATLMISAPVSLASRLITVPFAAKGAASDASAPIGNPHVHHQL